MESKKLISGLDLLKFIMAIFIVIIHLRPFRYASDFVQTEVNNVIGLAVPAFFTISAFLLFRKINNGGGNFTFNKQIQHFIKRLVILYAFWCVVWSPIVYLQKDYLQHPSLWSPLLLVKDFLFASVFDASWFLGALLVGVPLVYGLVRWFGTAFFWILPLAVMGFISLCPRYYPDVWESVNGWYRAYVCEGGMNLSFPAGLGWISLGYLLSRDKAIEVFSRWNSGWLWLLAIIEVIFIKRHIPLFGGILGVSLIFMAAYNWKLPEHPQLYKRLRTYSILFYVIHDCFKKIPKQLFGMENGPVLFFITMAFCLLASEIIIRLSKTKRLGWMKYAY